MNIHRKRQMKYRQAARIISDVDNHLGRACDFPNMQFRSVYANKVLNWQANHSVRSFTWN